MLSVFTKQKSNTWRTLGSPALFDIGLLVCAAVTVLLLQNNLLAYKAAFQNDL